MSDLHTEEDLTPVTDAELNEFFTSTRGTGVIDQYVARRICKELRDWRQFGKTSTSTDPSTAIELAQLSRELVQHSREMREQEKKIVELEKQRDMFKESSEYMNDQYMRSIGFFVRITEGKEDAIALAREALENR
jgi:uncharacterized protein with WD repeat